MDRPPARVPFNRPFTTGRELDYVRLALASHRLSGDGAFSRRCSRWLEQRTGAHKALLTHSCTGALEMAALLAGIEPGDEVIMPSFTFASTANAFVLRGAVVVFVDIDGRTLNIDVAEARQAITAKTRAIVPVHYAGIGCDMDELMDLAGRHRLLVIEDAAHSLLARYRGRPLGGIGHLGTLSFHETKNLMCGEGGALLVNDPALAERAEIVWEKGTNRSQFHRGEVDRYTWVDLGSSYLLSDLSAAFLWAQCEEAQEITTSRLDAWARYHEGFADLEQAGRVTRPHIPEDRQGNGHLYHLLVRSGAERDRVLQEVREAGVDAVFHYVPLHSSPAGRRFGRAHGRLPVTDDVAGRLIRLPLWVGMTDDDLECVTGAVRSALGVPGGAPVAGRKPRRAPARRSVVKPGDR
jgi:dTDP-4-amino-4,6-dideoxygalactose transaminase